MEICRLCKDLPQNLTDVYALNRGMTNQMLHFACQGEEYLLRIPGKGTADLINRRREKAVYEAIAAADATIADEVCYFDADTGYKVTKFWASARSCNPNSQADVAACMRHLRHFHEQKLMVPFRFDLRERLHRYEQLRGDRISFPDYDTVRGDIEELLRLTERCEKTCCLSHIDAVYDNFLFVRDPTGHTQTEQVRLIDWEYAGMCDPHIDIAMFCLYAGYERAETDRTIDLYFEGKCENHIRGKIYTYVAIAGLLWTNWCEFKAEQGDQYEDYERGQYLRAKQFCALAQETLLR